MRHQEPISSVVIRVNDHSEIGHHILDGVLAYTAHYGLPWTVTGFQSPATKLLESTTKTTITKRFVISFAPSDVDPLTESLIACNSDDHGPCTCRIWFDDESIGQQAAEYLFRAGYRQAVVFVGKPRDTRVRLIREKSFINAFGRLGGQCTELRPSIAMDVEGMLQWKSNVLATISKPLACFAYQDQEACWLADCFRKIGISVGKDIAIIGCEDTPAALGHHPALSSVRVSWRLLGHGAAQQIHRLAGGEPCTKKVLIQPLGVAVRASTSKGQTPFIERAEAVIKKSLPKGLSVEQLAKHLGVSSATLRRQYRQVQNLEPRAHIRWHRLIAAQDLLVDPRELSLSAIAKRGGWSSSKHFITDFRKAFGTTPIRFRTGTAPES